MFDYHVHSDFSVDCAIPMRASCEAAINAGITEIAFTDHVDHQPTDPGFGYYRIAEYFRAVDDVRAAFEGRLTVLAGAEIDFHTDTFDQVRRFVEQYGADYDFVIGSVHYGDAAQIIFPEYFTGKHLDAVMLPYLDQVAAAIETGWFDTIGHLDIPKRYLPKSLRTYDPMRFREGFDEIFAALIAGGISFEINTSGLRQTPKTSMPGPAVVRWYAEAGGRLVTTGTDSHAATTVGAGIAQALDMLELCGIDAMSSFRRRRRRQVPIAELRPALELVSCRQGD